MQGAQPPPHDFRAPGRESDADMRRVSHVGDITIRESADDVLVSFVPAQRSAQLHTTLRQVLLFTPIYFLPEAEGDSAGG